MWGWDISWDAAGCPVFPISPLGNKLENLPKSISEMVETADTARPARLHSSTWDRAGFIQLLHEPEPAKFLIPVAEDKHVPGRGAQFWSRIGFHLSST